MENSHAHLKETVEPGVFAEWQEVDVEILAFTDLGVKVAVNSEYAGLIYENQVYGRYREGQKLKGYIHFVREDGKIDVSLEPRKGSHVLSTTDKIIAHLKAGGGKSAFNDKSSPEEIKNEFQVSKKVFKQALGRLYKKNKIKITDKGIELTR